MSDLFKTIGTQNPAYLLADPQGADLIALSCEPGNGTLARGQIMYRKTSGMWAPAATGDIIITKMLAVLDEAVNTSANLTVAEDARAFRAGRLIASKLIVASSGTLTDAHKVVLRAQGIYLDVMDEADMDFSNSFAVITYDANGGTGDDVALNVQKGTVHTIEANDFTPPANKEFSVWNTKADGTGTDYDPADEYTAAANLTLYAVWVAVIVTITYKANTGTGDDVVAEAEQGSVYTIAANTFTPPGTDTFSKWNTAANGSGTDYDPADEYTAADDLILYAIWAA